jgi:hypothetical protein
LAFGVRRLSTNLVCFSVATEYKDVWKIDILGIVGDLAAINFRDIPAQFSYLLLKGGFSPSNNKQSISSRENDR